MGPVLFTRYLSKHSMIFALLDGSIKDNFIAKASLLQCVFVKNMNKRGKGPLKLIQRVKIAHSFLQSVSNQSHFIIFKLAYVVL